MNRIIERRKYTLEKEAERLKSLALRIRGHRATASRRGDRYYLLALTACGKREPIAGFSNSSDLEMVLRKLCVAERLSAEEYTKNMKALWQEQNLYAERRKGLVCIAHQLNYPDAALEQQATMEEAWAIRSKELLCATARDWLDVFRILPVHVGISDFERHDPRKPVEVDPVPIVDCDWISGELRIHNVRNFPTVYARASLWPDQNYVAELRRFHTDNIRNAWDRVVKRELLPLMEKVRTDGYNKKPGRELIREVMSRIAPWSILRPWPAASVDRKDKLKAGSVQSRLCKSVISRAAKNMIGRPELHRTFSYQDCITQK